MATNYDIHGNVSGGIPGADGFSPIVAITPLDSGYRVSIQDKYDTQTFEIFDGMDGVGIASVTANPDFTITVTLDDGTSVTTPSLKGVRGDKGDTGTGIQSIEWDGTSFAITLTDGSLYISPDLKGETGQTGPRGVGIQSIRFNSDYTMTVTLTDGTTETSQSLRGATGPQGPQYVLTAQDKADITAAVLAQMEDAETEGM